MSSETCDVKRQGSESQDETKYCFGMVLVSVKKWGLFISKSARD